MDRELVEKVTRMVIATLKENGHYPPGKAVKFWRHETPLPAPEVMNGESTLEEGDTGERVIISPYL